MAHTHNPPAVKPVPPKLPEVNFSDQGDVRYLHLGTEWIQGSMLLDFPYEQRHKLTYWSDTISGTTRRKCLRMSFMCRVP